MYTVVMVLMTVLNILIFCINADFIRQFKISQSDFINQQNRNTVDILNIKNKLGMFNEKRNKDH